MEKFLEINILRFSLALPVFGFQLLSSDISYDTNRTLGNCDLLTKLQLYFFQILQLSVKSLAHFSAVVSDLRSS